MAIDERNDVRMVQAAQNGDLGYEVVLELLVQLVHVHGLDGYGLSFLLANCQQGYGRAQRILATLARAESAGWWMPGERTM